MQDCENRPSLDKPRKVLVELTFKPVLNKGLDGQETFSTVAVAPAVKVAIPPQAAGAEFLHVSPDINQHGERTVDAVFSQQGLFVQDQATEGN